MITKKALLLSLSLFILFQLLDTWLGSGGGVGFPFKVFALDLPGLSSGFTNIGLLIIDLLFFYILAVIFWTSKLGKLISIAVLIIIFAIVTQPFRGVILFKSINELRAEYRQDCEAGGRIWSNGPGDAIGTCQ